MNKTNHAVSAKSPSPTRGRGVGERARFLDHAKQLRSNQTGAEQRLWYYLRAKRFMGLKFKRQKPMGPFIADFVCMEHKLIIEADGSQHGSDADAKRDAWFQSAGYTVLRFWNDEIVGQTEAVLERIRLTVEALSPGPSPACGRGEKDVPCPNPSSASGRGGKDVLSPTLSPGSGRGEQEGES